MARLSRWRTLAVGALACAIAPTARAQTPDAGAPTSPSAAPVDASPAPDPRVMKDVSGPLPKVTTPEWEEPPAAPVPPDDGPPELKRLHLNLWVSGIIAGWGWTYWITTEALRPDLASRICRWCDGDAAGNDTLNGFDKAVRKALRWYDTDGAAWASDIDAFMIVPLLTGGTLAVLEWQQDGFQHALEDAFVIAEAGAMTAVAGQVMKYASARARPYAHARNGGEFVPGYDPYPVPDDNLSFWSGHSSFAFCLATATGTVASMRGFKGAGWVWAGGLTAAAGVAYLRVAADCHYATDVLTGSLMGAAMGFAFPYFLHRPDGPLKGVRTKGFVVPEPGGGTVYFSGEF